MADKESVVRQTSEYTDIMEKNHMEIPWHDYAKADSNVLIAEADLIEKASVIGRVGLMMLSCGTGAWRVRTSMNRLSKELGVTCTVDVGLMSIGFNCFDGTDCVSQSLSIANTGVNTSKLYRMEQFVENFPKIEKQLTGEEIHKRLDEIEQIQRSIRPGSWEWLRRWRVALLRFFSAEDRWRCCWPLLPQVSVISSVPG